MMAKQCPKCGTSSDEHPFVGSFCAPCYLDMNMPELPKQLVIYRCRECNEQRFKNWGEESMHLSMEHALKNKVFGTPHVRILADSVLVKYGKIEHEFSIPLKEKESLCDLCSQKFSGYYEGIIQLRGKYARDPAFVEKLVLKLEKLTFVQKIVELKEGIDIYYGDKSITRSILSALKLKPKISNKLYGVKDGQLVYRTTFLIRG